MPRTALWKQTPCSGSTYEIVLPWMELWCLRAVLALSLSLCPQLSPGAAKDPATGRAGGEAGEHPHHHRSPLAAAA